MGKEQQKQREAIQRIQQRLSEQSPVRAPQATTMKGDREKRAMCNLVLSVI